MPTPRLPCQRLLPRNRLPAVAADGIRDCCARHPLAVLYCCLAAGAWVAVSTCRATDSGHRHDCVALFEESALSKAAELVPLLAGASQCMLLTLKHVQSVAPAIARHERQAWQLHPIIRASFRHLTAEARSLQQTQQQQQSQLPGLLAHMLKAPSPSLPQPHPLPGGGAEGGDGHTLLTSATSARDVV